MLQKVKDILKSPLLPQYIGSVVGAAIGIFVGGVISKQVEFEFRGETDANDSEFPEQ